MPNDTVAAITPVEDSFRAVVNTVESHPEASFLRVTGQVECPSPAWSVDLKPASQNSSPTVLTLDLVATKSADAAPDVVVRMPAAFNQSPPPAGVTGVEIRNGGKSFTVAVQTMEQLVCARAAAAEESAASAVAALNIKG